MCGKHDVRVSFSYDDNDNDAIDLTTNDMDADNLVSFIVAAIHEQRIKKTAKLRKTPKLTLLTSSFVNL